eukprot:118336-Chlamydomonas_euryale.AAC.2
MAICNPPGRLMAAVLMDVHDKVGCWFLRPAVPADLTYPTHPCRRKVQCHHHVSVCDVMLDENFSRTEGGTAGRSDFFATAFAKASEPHNEIVVLL